MPLNERILGQANKYCIFGMLTLLGGGDAGAQTGQKLILARRGASVIVTGKENRPRLAE